MSYMVVTLEVSKLSGWLNAAAPLNMPAIVVTPAVFQLEMSALKSVLPAKSPLMSVMDETSQSAMGPHVTMAAVASSSNAWTAALREAVLVKVPGGDSGGGGGDGGKGGEDGGEGGGGGDGDGGGGEGGEGGEGGDDGGCNCTTKDLVPCLGPFSKEKLCPKLGAAHSAPFQPSEYWSSMVRVHVAPSATANGELGDDDEGYGAPPLSVVPSEQLRLQLTSLPYDPLEQVIAEVTSLASQPPSHDASVNSSAVRQAPRVRP